MHFFTILNRHGGTLKTTDCEAFAQSVRHVLHGAGHTVEVYTIDGPALPVTLHQAVEDPKVDVVMVAGGDGTVSSAIGPCWRSGKRLAVLPAGTMNLFARSLGLPLDIHQALALFAHARPIAVDVATVEGRPFVHQFAVGLHPSAVALRDRMETRSRLGKIWASGRAAFSVMLHPPRFKVLISTDGDTPHAPARRRFAKFKRSPGERLSNLAIATNPFGEGHLPYADRLDQGVLGVCRTRPLSRQSAFSLMMHMAVGRWASHPDMEQTRAQRVHLTFTRHHRNAKALVDGELIPLPPQATIELHPKALTVLVAGV
ncbi:MAG: diacylglycerol kinase family protein [Pseudomonadota bacterium]